MGIEVFLKEIVTFIIVAGPHRDGGRRGGLDLASAKAGLELAPAKTGEMTSGGGSRIWVLDLGSDRGRERRATPSPDLFDLCFIGLTSMSLFDILFRVDEICKKYDKYDTDKHRELSVGIDDAFSRIYSIVDAEIENALRKSKMAAIETDRAKKVAMNAEIRRTKARLNEEVAKLQKLATKKSDTEL